MTADVAAVTDPGPRPVGSPRPSEAPLVARLRRHYPSPEYAVITGVADRPGEPTRTADALVMGLWPSRGLHLHGVEVKTSRRDWLRERADPSKADAVARYCDRWWILAGSVEIVDPSELPTGWGLLVPAARGAGLRAAVPAPPLDPDPIPRTFLAAVLRRYVGQYDPVVVADDAYRQGVAYGDRTARADERTRRPAGTTTDTDVAAAAARFALATGLHVRYADVDYWAPIIRAYDPERSWSEDAAAHARDMADRYAAAADALRAVADGLAPSTVDSTA